MFNQRLKELRKQKNLSQLEMANTLGVARTTYSMYEQGKRSPEISIIIKIAEYHNVSIDYLLGRKMHSKDNTSKPTLDIIDIFHSKNIMDSEFLKVSNWETLGKSQIIELENYFNYLLHKSKE